VLLIFNIMSRRTDRRGSGFPGNALGNELSEVSKSITNSRGKRKSINPDVSIEDDGDPRSRRKLNHSDSVLKLIESAHYVRMNRDKVLGFGFNIRGRKNEPGDETLVQHQGQYVRSVDFEGEAHKWGLRAGDRILQVNGTDCHLLGHKHVVALIKASPDSIVLKLVSDSNMARKCKEITTTLLKEDSSPVRNKATETPTFNVTMVEHPNQPLGRTKLLRSMIERGLRGEKKDYDEDGDDDDEDEDDDDDDADNDELACALDGKPNTRGNVRTRSLRPEPELRRMKRESPEWL